MKDISISDSSKDVQTIDLNTISKTYLGSKIASGIPNLEFIQPPSLPDAESEKTYLSLKLKAPWKIALGSKAIDARDVILEISWQSRKKGKKDLQGMLKASIRIGSNVIPVSCDILSEKAILTGVIPGIRLSLLIQELCGIDAMRSLAMPLGIHALELSDFYLSLTLQDASLSLGGKCQNGDAEIMIAPSGEVCDFLMAIRPEASWKLSQIYEGVSGPDNLSLSDALMVISSSDLPYPTGGRLSLNLMKSVKKSFLIAKGLNLVSSISPSQINLDKVLGLKNPLDLCGKMGEKWYDLEFQINLEGSFPLNKNQTMSGITIYIRPFQNEICILKGVIEAASGDARLKFPGIMTLAGDSYRFRSSGELEWPEPFNIKETKILNLVFSLDMDCKTGSQKAEMAGNLYLGSHVIPICIPADSAAQGMIRAGIDKADLASFLPAFCDKEKAATLAERLKKEELNVEFAGAEIVLSSQETAPQAGPDRSPKPQGGKIIASGALPGRELKSREDASKKPPVGPSPGSGGSKKGLQISGSLYLQGMKGEGRLDIAYGDRLELYASMHEIEVADVFSLKGAPDLPKLHILIDARDEYAPKAELNGVVSLLGIGKSIQMQMTEGLFQFRIDDKIFNAFQSSLQGKALDFASPDRIYITAELKEDFYNYIRDSAGPLLRKAADGIAARIRDSEKAVSQAEEKVKERSGELERSRQEKDKKRTGEARELEKASSVQAAAQSKVISLKDQINSIEKSIDQMERNLDRKWRAIENASWEEQLWRQIEYAEEAQRDMPLITGLYQKIGDLEIESWNAFQDLEKAKLALRSRQSIDLSLPIDSDPEVAAKQILLEAESRGLERAREAHEILRRSLGANLDLAGRISGCRQEELLRISAASFKGNLSAISGGRVDLILNLSFAANPVQTVQMDFDFKDPMAGARHLAGMLLPLSS